MVDMVTGNLNFIKCLTTKRFLTVAIFSIVTSLLVPAQANASWFKEAFTFRKDQKQAITSTSNDLPPIEVIAPYYNQKEAAQWSRYHTRKNMKAVPYIEGSASLVMRQQVQKRDFRKMKAWPGNLKENPNTKILPQGYEAILWRDYVNRLKKNSKKTFIGDPGFANRLPENRTASIGQKTMIGNPIKSWKDNPAENSGVTPRKGDFDYKEANNKRRIITDHITSNQQQRTMPVQRNMQGMQHGKTSISMPSNNARNNQSNDLPNNYTVIEGDSLSGISGKNQIYGDWKMWPLIYDANKNQLNDPDLIYPKQNLGIPRDYTSEQSMNAKRRALDKKPPYSFYDGR